MNDRNSVVWTRFPVALLAAFLCCTLWGSAIPAIKAAYHLFQIAEDDTASKILLAGVRFTLAGLLTILLGSVASKRLIRLKRSSAGKIVILGLTQTVGQYFFFFIAVANTSGVRSSLINASGNFLAILFAWWVFRLEKLSLKKLLGCLVGFSGIILILGGFQALFTGEAIRPEGEGAMLIADVFYALSVCCIKIFSRDEDPVALSGYQFVFGGIILSVVGLIMGGRLIFYSGACYANLIYMGFISAGAYTLWGVLLKYNPVSRIAVFGFINPVMSVLLSALILGENREAFSPTGLLALVLISLGIIIVNM